MRSFTQGGYYHFRKAFSSHCGEISGKKFTSARQRKSGRAPNQAEYRARWLKSLEQSAHAVERFGVGYDDRLVPRV